MTPVPAHLHSKYSAFIAEEVMGSIRHSVVNDLTALAALCYRLKVEHLAQLTDMTTSKAAHELIDSIQGYVGTASRRLAVSFAPEPAEPVRNVDVNALLRAIARQMPPPAGISVKEPAPEPAWLRVDPLELELALALLLANAYDAAEGPVVRLRSEGAANNTLRIEIVNDGPVPDEHALTSAFEAFFTTKEGRLGLGLNIVRRIAARWGGTLDLSPGEDGRGVVTRLSLPTPAYAA
jgi:signal transduction histidine kinase